MNMGVRVSFELCFSQINAQGWHMQDHMLTLFFFHFLRKRSTVLHSSYIIYIPTNNVGGVPFSPRPLQHLISLCLNFTIYKMGLIIVGSISWG